MNSRANGSRRDPGEFTTWSWPAVQTPVDVFFCLSEAVFPKYSHRLKRKERFNPPAPSLSALSSACTGSAPDRAGAALIQLTT